VEEVEAEEEATETMVERHNRQPRQP
jgi:hypothetical protein